MNLQVVVLERLDEAGEQLRVVLHRDASVNGDSTECLGRWIRRFSMALALALTLTLALALTLTLTLSLALALTLIVIRVFNLH